MSVPATSRAFLKRAVRRAIHAMGGIAPGARATGRCKSQVGRWHSINDDDLPTLDAALALDEMAVASGGQAEILHAMAGELNHVAFQLPEMESGGDAITLQMAEATGEFGDVASALVEALRDGEVDAREQRRIAREIDEAMVKLAQLRALVTGEVREPQAVREVA
jgi:hypothetical protein